MPVVHLTEKFNVKRASDILAAYSIDSEVIDNDTKRLLSAYVNSAVNGCVSVEYKVKHDIGRYYTTTSRIKPTNFTYMNMWGVMRSSLASDYYWDVDMVNSNPTIALQTFKKLGIACPLLEEYVCDRENILLDIAESTGVTRTKAKNLFIRLGFGGSVKSWATDHNIQVKQIPSFPKAFEKEIQRNIVALLNSDHANVRVAYDIVQRNAIEKKKTPKQTRASHYAYVMQEIERNCLDSMYKTVVKKSRIVGAMIHDGLMVLKEHGESTCDPALIDAIEAGIFEDTGYKLNIVVKPWQTVHIQPSVDVEKSEYLKAVIKRKMVDRDPDLDGFRITGDDDDCITFETKRIKGTITKPAENRWGRILTVQTEGGYEEVGLIYEDVPINRTLFDVCSSLPTNAKKFLFNQRDSSEATLTSATPNVDAQIVLHSPMSTDKYFSVRLPGVKDKSITLPCKVNKLTQVIEEHLQQFDAQNKIGAFMHIENVNVSLNYWVQPTDDNKPSDFAQLRAKLLTYAAERKLRKKDGFVYGPIKECPCAYVNMMTYGEYINLVLKGDSIYTSNPKRFRECIEYMRDYRDDEMPILVSDKSILSFSNGILDIVTMSFVPYDHISDELLKKTARNHIQQDYTGDSATPLLDIVLDAQFDVDVADLLMALLGRMMYEVNSLDRWQVMPYLSGVGGTGKSLIIDVLQSFFAPEAVGNLASKREDVFGLANLLDKEIIVGRDMPEKLSGALPQEVMQSMTSGEGMEIARKNATSINMAWKTPILLGSNHPLDYVNTGNNIGRRIVVFKFDNVVKNPREFLFKEIVETELPNVICRALQCYMQLRDTVAAAGSFWSIVPKRILEWQDKLAASTNKLYEYLKMDNDDRGIIITYEEGTVTWLSDFETQFKKKMEAKFVNDPAVFYKFGFRVSDGRENVCSACKQIAKLRGGACCDFYASSKKRMTKDVIWGMKMVEVDFME
jgi:hypothetical protein